MQKLNLLDSPEKLHSNHTNPTPRGIGFLLILTVTLFYLIFPFSKMQSQEYKVILILSCVLSAIFFLEDIKGLTYKIRLIAQGVFSLILVHMLQKDILSLFQYLSFQMTILLYVVIFVGIIWFMNLYNFMDGLDLMTTVNTLFIVCGISVLLYIKYIMKSTAVEEFIQFKYLAATIAGPLLAFGYFNKPVARIFIGDSGSVVLGFLVSFLLIKSSKSIGISNAIILANYYICDATISLFLRIKRGERISEASKVANFFQKAKHSGRSVVNILMHVSLLNVLLLANGVINIFTEHKFCYLLCLLSVFETLILLYKFQKSFIYKASFIKITK